MPSETKQAVEWALQQQVTDRYGRVIKVQDANGVINQQLLVDFTRQYFNDHAIKYPTFNYYDLEPYLN